MKALVLARKHSDRRKLKRAYEERGYQVTVAAKNSTHLPNGKNEFDCVSVGPNEHNYWIRILSSIRMVG